MRVVTEIAVVNVVIRVGLIREQARPERIEVVELPPALLRTSS